MNNAIVNLEQIILMRVNTSISEIIKDVNKCFNDLLTLIVTTADQMSQSIQADIMNSNNPVERFKPINEKSLLMEMQKTLPYFAQNINQFQGTNVQVKDECNSDSMKESTNETMSAVSTNGNKNIVNNYSLPMNPIKSTIYQHAEENKDFKAEIDIQSGLFKCSMCGYSTKRKQHFNSHIKQVHEKVKDFNCDLCNYATTHKNRLNTHRNAAHGISISC